ncbi:sugar ABC transporter substrate-binding protein [Bacillus tianshenii]|uniref:sugar ABC transporter substrate-binding protein n=1 Tax=Sutcliffiella tianshenii TaxID=1463404 RepID=UPI0021E536A8
MKKFKFLIVMMLSFIIILSGCSSNKETSGNSKSLKVWQMGAASWDPLIKEFEKETGIDVEIQAIPWDQAHDKILTAVASGKGPDVLQMGSTQMVQFAGAGAFLDLTDKLDEYPNMASDNFYEGALKTSVIDGKTYGIPWHVDTRLLYYRTDLLGEVGYPEGPETWEDLLDASRQLAARGDDQYSVDLGTDINHIWSYAWQQGWEYDIEKGAENFADPAFKKMVEYYQTFYEEELSQLEKGKDGVQAFADGSKPMFFSGPWMMGIVKEQAPDIDGKWDVRVMPDGGTNKSMIGGSHLTIFHSTKKEEQALDFVNWMASPETQLKWHELGSELPANIKAWEDSAFTDNSMVATFGEQLKNTETPPNIKENNRIGQEVLKMLEQVAHGNKDIDSAIEGLQAEVSKILSE